MPVTHHFHCQNFPPNNVQFILFIIPLIIIWSRLNKWQNESPHMYKWGFSESGRKYSKISPQAENEFLHPCREAFLSWILASSRTMIHDAIHAIGKTHHFFYHQSQEMYAMRETKHKWSFCEKNYELGSHSQPWSTTASGRHRRQDFLSPAESESVASRWIVVYRLTVNAFKHRSSVLVRYKFGRTDRLSLFVYAKLQKNSV